MTIRISLISDLHLEFDPSFRVQTEGNLLLCNGDIGVVDHLKKLGKENLVKGEMRKYHHAETVHSFFKDACSKFDKVVWIVGNHEHYHGTFEDTVDIAKEKIQFPNLHILDDDYLDYEGYRIIGSTLWTDLNRNCPITEMTLRNSMNDYHIIQKRTPAYRKFLPRDSFDLHKKSVERISEFVEYHDNIIVATHHAPSPKSIHSRFANDYHMNGGYVSNLEKFIEETPQIKYWFHGHVHNCFDYIVGETRIMTNPKGYHNENPQFNPEFSIEV